MPRIVFCFGKEKTDQSFFRCIILKWKKKPPVQQTVAAEAGFCLVQHGRIRRHGRFHRRDERSLSLLNRPNREKRLQEVIDTAFVLKNARKDIKYDR